MKKGKNRILSLFLALVMLLSVLSAGIAAYAEDLSGGEAVSYGEEIGTYEETEGDISLPEEGSEDLTDESSEIPEISQNTEEETLVPEGGQTLPEEDSTLDGGENPKIQEPSADNGEETGNPQTSEDVTEEEPEIPETLVEEDPEGGKIEENIPVKEEDITLKEEDIILKEEEIPEGKPFEHKALVDKVIVSVSAEAGAFPEGAHLSVEKVPKKEQADVDAAVETERTENTNVAVSYTFDIKVLDELENELQPAEGKEVKVSFSMAEIANDNLEPKVYHVYKAEEEKEELSAETLQVVEKEGHTATVITGGFSYYTVEFTYGDKQYVMEGDSSIYLDDILAYVGLSGQVTDVEVSNPLLFAVYEDENGDLYVVSNEPFDTEEWMKVTIDGIVYHIVVTDDYINPDYPGVDLTGKVVQDGDINHFTQSMPLATIFIDESILNINLYNNEDFNNKITFENLTGNSDFFFDTTSSGSNYTASNSTNYGKFKYKGTLQSNQDNFFSGNIAKYTIADAAEYTDANGNTKRANIVITYSDLHLVLQNNTGPYTPASGKDIWLWDTNRVYPAVDSSSPSRLGMKVNVNVQILDADDNPVPGRFIYPVIDVDVNRLGNSSFGALWDAANNRNYSEQTELVSGYDGKIWIPTSFKEGVTVVDDGNGGENLLVYPKAEDLNTFDGGFITLADNATGITTTLMGAAWNSSYSTGVESYILGGPANTKVNLKIAESTDEGGSISASSKDYTEDIEPDGINQKKTIIAARAQTVKFTMTPDSGYRMKNIYVSDSNLNILDAVQTGTATAISKNDPNLMKGPNGTYIYMMSAIDSEKSIHVEWEPVRKLKLTKEAGESGEFDFEIEVTKGDKWYNLDTGEEVDSKHINTATLKSKQSIEWEIPEGWTYTITEVDLPGWQLESAKNDRGTVGKENIEAIFTNVKEHTLKITKQTHENVAGSFNFKVKIWKGDEVLNLNGVTELTPDTGGYYKFTLANGGEQSIPGIPTGYSYEILEETADGWELVKVGIFNKSSTILTGAGTYKIEGLTGVTLTDNDIESLVSQYDNIKVRYKYYEDGTNPAIREVIAEEAKDETLLEQYFNTEISQIDSGKKTVRPSDIGNVATHFANETITVGTVSLDVTDKDGTNTYQSGNIHAQRISSSSSNITIRDLSTITPTVTVNGHDIGDISGSHFQKDPNDRTKIRLRYDKDGLINTSGGLNAEKFCSYNDTIVLRYPDAATLSDGVTTKDVIITVSDISLYIPTDTNAHINFKGAVFDYSSGPSIYAKSLGTCSHPYGVTETVNIRVDGAPDGSTFEFEASGIDSTTGFSNIKDATLNGNFAEDIEFTGGVIGNAPTSGSPRTVRADAQTGLTFKATTSTQNLLAEEMPLAISSTPSSDFTSITSDPFTISIRKSGISGSVTQKTDPGSVETYYEVILGEGESIEIPGGGVYKISKLNDGTGNWDPHTKVTEEEPPPGNVTGVISTGDSDVSFLNKKIKDLVITKVITGNMGNKTKKFDFTLVLNDPDGNPITGLTVEGLTEYPENSGTYTFKLSHEESIKIEALETGTTYTVSETDTDYTETFAITGGNVVTSQSGLKTEVMTIQETNGDTVTFTNDKNTPVPTGIFDSMNPYIWITGISAACLAVVITGRRKQDD